MTKYLLAIIISAFTTHAQAWTFNHSWVDPNLIHNTCTGSTDAVQIGADRTEQCCTDRKCLEPASNGNGCAKYDYTDSGCNGWATKTITSFAKHNQVPAVNETCYHPSCNIRAALQILGNPGGVQPLTNSTASVRKAVNAINIETQNYAFVLYRS